MKRPVSLLFALGVFGLLGACGGGGDSAGGAGPAPAPAPGPAPAPAPVPPPAAPAFSGFDFTVTTGSFWEYRWDFFHQSGSSSGTTTSRDQGRFWVVLGAPTTIAGVNAYAVEVLGKSQAKGDRSFAPRWKYLAMNGNKLLGSADGTTLQTVFDAATGKWAGGGFFTTLDASRLTVAQSSLLDNSYLRTDAIRAGRSLSTSECEFFPGIGTICGGSVSQTLIENDYFKGGVGPVGFYYKNSASFSGGGFLSFSNWEHHLGKTASSREGQALPFTAEDGAAHAAPASAQPVAPGAVVRGDVATTDAGMTINLPVSGTVVPLSIEDWYALTVSAPMRVRLTLSFEASPTADLDLYLVTQDSRGLTFQALSILDNPAEKYGNETITFSLPAAGTYYIAVDAFATPSGRAPYQLQVE